MTPISPEDWLWECSQVDDDAAGPVPDEATLRAYRRGHLDAARQTRIEWALARSAVARQRLIQLAGVRLAAPPGWMRARVLGLATPRPRPRLHASWPLVAAAAVLAVALPLGWLAMRTPAPGADLGQLSFDVRVEGLAATRALPGDARAEPDTRVRVIVEQAGPATAGLAYSLYRVDDGALHRLVPAQEVDVQTFRGGAVLATTGERLVGPAPGARRFFVLVSGVRPPPDGLALEAGRRAEETLAARTRGRVLTRWLTIVEPDSGAR